MRYINSRFTYLITCIIFAVFDVSVSQYNHVLIATSVFNTNLKTNITGNAGHDCPARSSSHRYRNFCILLMTNGFFRPLLNNNCTF